jgi:hypothetical protein
MCLSIVNHNLNICFDIGNLSSPKFRYDDFQLILFIIALVSFYFYFF